MPLTNWLGWWKAKWIVSEWERVSGKKLDGKTRKQAVKEVFRVLNGWNWREAGTAIVGGMSDSVWSGLGFILGFGSYDKNEAQRVIADLSEKYVGKRVMVLL